MLTAGKSNLAEEKTVPGSGTARWRSPGFERESRTLDTTMRVTTPENISFHYQITGPFRRVFAYGLDVLISLGTYFGLVFLMYMLLMFAIMPLAAMVGGAGLIEVIMGVLGGLIAVGYFIVYWFYGAYMETYFNGQTLGKRITKMRVISTDGSAIDGVQATLRNFFRLLDIMPFVSFTALFQVEEAIPGGLPTCLFGLVIMTLSRKFQRVGDLVANTVVVNEEKKRHPDLATFVDERVPGLAELIPTSYIVPASMASAIADYVDHRRYLPFQRASEIASNVAGPLIERFGLQPNTDHDLFLCALYYKTFVSSENGESNGLPLPGTALVVPPQTATVAEPAETDDNIPLDNSDFQADTQ